MPYLLVQNKRNKQARIPSSVLGYYQKMGFEVVDELKNVNTSKQKISAEIVYTNETIKEKEPENIKIDNTISIQEEPIIPEKTEDEIWLDNVKSKPLGNWNKEEMEKFRQLYNLDFSGKQVKEIREIIKLKLGE